LFSRLVPLIRSVVSVPAGLMRMSLLRFAVLTTIGSLVWNFLLVGAGYQLGSRWEQISALIGRWSDVMLVLAVLSLVAGVVWLWRRRPAPTRTA
jgi:membrane protein DedA with SNARE-associated domain